MPQPSPDPDAADRHACAALLRGGSRSFFAAGRLLPRTIREPAGALYAFCRVADDVIDDGGGAAGLDQLRERLAGIHDGRPWPIPADRAFAAVVARYAIPRALPEALLEGFAWDAAGRRYRDIASLRAYAARVAGAVGAMMALVMGARSPAALARACDLGVAMQLTNIARDVAEDARAGRVYLPLDWLEQEGIDPDAWLAAPVHSPALAGVVRRLLAEADRLYHRAAAGVAALPLACRPGIGAALLLYGAIGRELERQGCDPFAGRAVVPARRKAWLLARAPLALLPGGASDAPPLAETAFLVDAAAAARPRRPARDLDAQVAWLFDLFDRLERRELARRA